MQFPGWSSIAVGDSSGRGFCLKSTTNLRGKIKRDTHDDLAQMLVGLLPRLKNALGIAEAARVSL